MARAKRWTTTFKSILGHTCVVNIYKEGYTGSTVDTLTPAPHCFEWQESESHDLMNDVIRYRTGYIRVKETYDGELDDVYPTDYFSRYVEFYYDSVLVFTGYLQVQEFSNDWVAYPRQVDFAVISPLGLSGKKSVSVVYPPTSITLGSMVDQVLSGLNAAYTKVYVPYQYYNLDSTVFSLVFSPWNKDYHHSDVSGIVDELLSPVSYQYVIEAICKAWGWVVHDTPDGIVFTSFDYTGRYYYYNVGNVGGSLYQSSIPTALTALTDYMTLADDNATESLIRPMTAISMDYDGELPDNLKITLDRCRFYGVYGYGSTIRTSLCSLWPRTDEISLAPGGGITFDSNNLISSYGSYAVALDGMEGILYAIDPSAPSGSLMFTVKYYVATNGHDWGLNYSVMAGKYIANLENDDDEIVHNITTSMSVNSDSIEVSFYLFYNSSFPLPTDKVLIFIKDIKFVLKQSSMPYAEYQNAPSDVPDKLPVGTTKPISDDVTLPITFYRFSTNMIGASQQSVPSTRYQYLLSTRNELQCRFRGASLPAGFHTMLFSFWKSGWHWRIITASFDAWNSEFTLTLERSSTI